MCNAIVGNFSYVKKPSTGPGTDATISVLAAACVISLRHTQRVLSSTHLRCTAAKRVARAANANPISENNFSRGRILARLFKTSDLTGSCCGTPPDCTTLLLFLRRPLFSILSAASISPPPHPCSVSVVPAHFLRTAFKPRSFLAIKECPRSFAVTYGCAGNNDKR